MRQEQADQILAEWLDRTGSGPMALRRFVTDALPDFDACAFSPDRRLTTDRRATPTILGLTRDHLYAIELADVDGVRGFRFERWRLDQTTVALTEWLESAPGGDARRRRWTLRLPSDERVIETDEAAIDDEPPPLERLMRVLLDRAS